MSDTNIDLQEQVARIRRMQEESDKFAAEQRKLIAEQYKLMAEGAKFRREPWIALLTGSAALLAAGAAIGGLLVKVYGL